MILSRTSELTSTSSLTVTSLHGPFLFLFFFFFGGRSIHDIHSLFFQPLYNGHFLPYCNCEIEIIGKIKKKYRRAKRKNALLKEKITNYSDYFTFNGVLYSTANDPQPKMIPRPQVIPKMGRK